ncbi:Tyrosine-protein phosphatase non-receptor type 9 [Trichoplax sp. H2]|nr:Tyrosine-protein phosphatase non-receptor type 9 [Trichoplax sp. H2]|eukprot:RDD45183.1 Tyrosine-protein phosphatase non-receptor type 9 [Trichoplax sp. H2]
MAMAACENNHQPKGTDSSASSETEEVRQELIQQFLEDIQTLQEMDDNFTNINTQTAEIFVAARKNDIKRAKTLFQQHLDFRKKYNLCRINPNDKDLQDELRSRRFYITRLGDKDHASVLLLTAHRYKKEENSIQTFLKSMIFQLDQILKDPRTRQSGVILLIDLTTVGITSGEKDFVRTILKVIQGNYPISVKKILAINCSLILRYAAKFYFEILNRKLRDRVVFVDNSSLKKFVPEDALPNELGGNSKFCYNIWLNKLTNSCHIYDVQKGFYYTRTSELKRQKSTGQAALNFQDLKDRTNDREQLLEEYQEISKKSRWDEESKGINFESSLKPCNRKKNRYQNILCLESSRVRLPKDIGDDNSNEDCSYIHANYVNGYSNGNAYIATQGPLPDTMTDFWKMIWAEKVNIIVMLARLYENGRVKCSQYWPNDGEILIYGKLTVEHESTTEKEHYVLHKLSIYCEESEGSLSTRCIYLFRFTSWPDFGIPPSASPLLKMIENINHLNRSVNSSVDDNTNSKEQPLPPIVIHCSAGVGRTGTYATVDICCQQFAKTRKVNIMETVCAIRSQRDAMIQTWQQYEFCYKAVLEFAEKNVSPTTNSLSEE